MKSLKCPKCQGTAVVADGQVEGRFTGILAKLFGKVVFMPLRVVICTDTFFQQFLCVGCGAQLPWHGEGLVSVKLPVEGVN